MKKGVLLDNVPQKLKYTGQIELETFWAASPFLRWQDSRFHQDPSPLFKWKINIIIMISFIDDIGKYNGNQFSFQYNIPSYSMKHGLGS